jgi:phosphatidate phosphatase PAH1
MIVIKQPDGKLKSTPLNVRFGNFRVIKAKYKRVKVNVNGKDIPLQMKLNEFGQAYVLRKKFNKKYRKKDFNDNLNDKSSGSDSLGENSDKSDKSDDNEEIHKNSKSLPRKEERNFNNNEYHSPEIGMRFEFKNKNVLNNDKNNNNSKNNIFTIKYQKFEDKNINKENNENKEKKIEKKNSFENTENENSLENKKNVNLNLNNLFENNINLNNKNNSFLNDKNIFELSNCWNNIYKKKSNKNFNALEEFEENEISEEEFFKEPWKALNNNNLAIKYGKTIYT